MSGDVIQKANGKTLSSVDELGELKSSFSPVRRGNLVSNTECGVFGTINTTGMELDRPIEIGYKHEVQTGKATVITTASNQKRYFDAGNGKQHERAEKGSVKAKSNKNVVLIVTHCPFLNNSII